MAERINGLARIVLGEIERRRGGDMGLVVAIDGRCAAGKTTLAARLREIYGCNVIHMDEFFLRPEQRSEARLNTPGGNVDHERFLEEALLPLRNGGEFSYRPYDCHIRALGGPVCVKTGKLTVVEGSYSCHPALWEHYDLRVFLSLSPEEQWRRILLREGPEGAEEFRERWIPMEESYFAAYQIAQRCELVLDAGAD